MKIKLNQKIIKERCGAVSFKRGEAFYRNGKVVIEEVTPTSLQAIVHGVEYFQVHLEKDSEGFQATCSCPSLSSIDKDCQHVAAVLLAWQHHQQDMKQGEHTAADQTEGELSEGLLQLFESKQPLKSGQQLHFENRQVLETIIFCKGIAARGNTRFGIEISIAAQRVADIRDFLESVKEGRCHTLSNEFQYDPNKHCFDSVTNAIIDQLILVIDDEKMYHQALPTTAVHQDKRMLLVPASFWKNVEPLLVRAPQVNLQYSGKSYQQFRVTDEPLPLTFEFTGTEENGYQLIIHGLSQMMILKEYDTVLFAGKAVVIKRGEVERLHELKRMLENSRTNEILIPSHQLKYYLEKLLPILRNIGEVHLSGDITAQLHKTPLQAKLYLDRVKNRLLAGLEFHYKNVVINPLDYRQPKVGSMVIRDMEKEEVILKLMEESQYSQTESGYYLQNEELEYNFLYHVLPKLQKVVQVYATTAVRIRIVPKTTIPKIKVRHYKERNHLLEFSFKIDGIPETEIKEVLAALEEKRKYYRLRDGALLSLETKEMEEIKRFLHAVPVQDDEWEERFEVPVVEGLRLLNYFEDNDVVSHEASFREFIEKLQHPERLQFNVPAQLEGILRNYQKHGFNWMKTLASYGFGGILADSMGLGKTVQSIAFILSELSIISEKGQPALIVCPSSVTYNWQSEIMKFAPDIGTVIMDGTKSERVKLQTELDGIDVLITSYPLLRSDLSWYVKQEFHVVFFDEAQVFKNPLTQTARAVKKLQANHRFALTGTPMENALEELWSIFHVVFPELFLGLREYSELTNKQIARRIRPFMLRRVKEDVLDELPRKKEVLEMSELLPEQKKLYAAYLAKLRHKTLKHLDKETIRKNRIKVLAGLTRLRQICCHPRLFVDGYTGTSAKFEQLLQIVEDARRSGRRLLIFSQFTKMLQMIGQELAIQEISHFYLDGQTPSEERLELCNRYNAGERDIFLISLKAGGTGLNLTGADTVIFYDSWWNPAVEEQAADRAHRIGQKQTVQVIKLVAKGTIEEKMNELQDRKRHLIEEVIDPKNGHLVTLTEEDIRDLLS
ncbi:DEAD/DEAH box helicase [Schinkia azotoformans]|uniref:Putative helicase n=1 Tax=Schinkia azotoformans LMG 9581 TaxID=1131731 RepID=K6D8G6_SCHAZ|nr:DEAD/DEAH box helicase [Schinkia azotoformans]EKN64579.1 putative helicase [Schinkia azotoformans LMG 9581]MEC1637887.1 DEAD/DEAH box helicase [Schinkia azotoformans]MEC1944783.1 DEAD/DEAH box helicase [Schinkia azotoformans]MED4354135.1 DEAD/DEAH box helicase [Schinkia azotoformans]